MARYLESPNQCVLIDPALAFIVVRADDPGRVIDLSALDRRLSLPPCIGSTVGPIGRDGPPALSSDTTWKWRLRSRSQRYALGTGLGVSDLRYSSQGIVLRWQIWP